MTLRRRSRARVGLPLLIKAAAGGGGRGIRLVERWEDGAAEAFERATAEATRRVRRRHGVPRDAAAAQPSHRGPDRRRPRRPLPGARPARLQRATPPPEGDRGGAAAAARPPPSTAALRAAAVRLAQAAGYIRRRHGRVPARSRRPVVLLPRGQPAPAGRARAHRDADRARPGRAADRNRARRAACRRARRPNAATRSRRACAPRIRPPISRPRPARSCSSTCPAARRARRHRRRARAAPCRRSSTSSSPR